MSLSLLLDRNNSVGFILFYICIWFYFICLATIYSKRKIPLSQIVLCLVILLLVLFLLTYSCHFQSMCYKVSFIYTHPILFLHLHLSGKNTIFFFIKFYIQTYNEILEISHDLSTYKFCIKISNEQ